jgi:hypothetical protein
MNHDMIPLRATIAVAAMTRYEPQARWGMNNKTSTSSASRQTRKSMTVMMNRMRRYLDECAGPWKCAAPAMTKMTNVRKAATGWTIRIDDSDSRTLAGRSNDGASDGKRFTMS